MQVGTRPRVVSFCLNTFDFQRYEVTSRCFVSAGEALFEDRGIGGEVALSVLRQSVTELQLFPNVGVVRTSLVHTTSLYPAPGVVTNTFGRAGSPSSFCRNR